jgi:hypothetical protein
MSPQRKGQLPNWFRQTDYAFADSNGLSPLGWARMLGTRNRMDRDRVLDRNFPIPDLEKYVNDYLERARPSAHANDSSDPLGRYFFEGDAAFDVLEIPEDDGLLNAAWRALIYALREVGGRPALVVNLDVSDGALIEAFTNWLAKLRKQEGPGPEIRRRGRKARVPKNPITDAHFGTWRKNRILAVLDLDLVAEARAEALLTDWAIGTEVLGHASDATKLGREARRVAKEALAAEGTLWAQIKGGKIAQ